MDRLVLKPEAITTYYVEQKRLYGHVNMFMYERKQYSPVYMLKTTDTDALHLMPSNVP